MGRYKKITWREYKGLGEINVFASYPVNNIAKNIIQKTNKDVVEFNLEDDVDYIKNYIMKMPVTTDLKAIIIDGNETVTYTESELWELEELSIKLKVPILFMTNLLPSAKNKKYPVLEDLGNEDLVKRADVIFLQNNTKTNNCVLSKNTFGKIGILQDE